MLLKRLKKQSMSENQNLFKVPADYFEALDASVWKQIEKEKKSSANFKVPPTYFDTLELKVLQKSVFSKRRFEETAIQYLISIAALLFVLVSIVSSDAVNGEKIMNHYLETYQLHEMDSYEMVSYFDHTNVSFSEWVTIPEAADIILQEDMMADYFEYTDLTNVTD